MLWKVFVGDKAIPQFLLFSLERALVLFWDPSSLRRKQEARALLSAFKALGHLVFFFFLFPFAVGSDLLNCKWLYDTLFPGFLVWQFGSVWLCQCVRGNSYQKNAVSNIFLRPSKQHCNDWCYEKFWLYHWYHLPLQQSILQVLSAKKISPFRSPNLNQL